MLINALKIARHTLKEELDTNADNTSVVYPAEALAEVNEIVQRIEALEFKLDCPLWSKGYRFEDGVSWKA